MEAERCRQCGEDSDRRSWRPNVTDGTPDFWESRKHRKGVARMWPGLNPQHTERTRFKYVGVHPSDFYQKCIWRFEVSENGFAMLLSFVDDRYRCLLLGDGKAMAADLGTDLPEAKKKFVQVWLKTAPS